MPRQKKGGQSLVEGLEEAVPQDNLDRFGTEQGETMNLLERLSTQYPEARRPTLFNRMEAANEFREAFELIGGVPRLAVWAHYNPTEFYRLYGKMLPSGADNTTKHSGNVTIKPALQPSGLDE